MPKLFAGLDRGELLTIGGLIGGTAAVFWTLTKVQSADAAGDDVPLIDPATATPDQSTVPEGGALSDYWSYNQPAYNVAPSALPVQSTNAPAGDGGQPGYAGPDFASYLLGNLANLLGGAGAGSSAANTASATPTGTPPPPSAGAAPANTSPIIQVPPVAPYTPAILSPPPPPVVYSPPPPPAAPVQNLGAQRAAY